MLFLTNDRQVLEAAMPGLDEKLASCDPGSLESPTGPGVALFQAAGGATSATAVASTGIGGARGTGPGSTCALIRTRARTGAKARASGKLTRRRHGGTPFIRPA